jgi:hypothetical protein
MLTSRRRAANLGAPILAPRHQDEIRAVAEDLQAGKLSAPAAEEAMRRWARAAYRREVKTFMVDCSMGPNMQMPTSLVTEPTLVLSYAAAHFRPRSAPAGQCAILGTMPVGTEAVEATSL